MSPTTHTPDADQQRARTPESEPPSQAFSEALRLVAQLRAYVSYYVSSRLDQLKLSLRSIVIWVAIGVVGFIALAAVVVMAIVQLLGGIAGGIAQVVPGHPWLGNIFTGLIMLGVVFFGMWWGIGFIGRMSRSVIIAKYEAYKRQQRQQFGQSVDDRAN